MVPTPGEPPATRADEVALEPGPERPEGRYQCDDGAELAASMAAGRELRRAAAAEPGEVGEARRRYAELLSRGLVFKRHGRVSWRVPPARAPLSARQMATLHALGPAVDRLLQAVARALPDSEPLRRFLGFPACEEEVYLAHRFAASAPSFFKLDLTPDASGELRLLEIQIVMISLGIAQGLREVYGPHPELPGIAAGYEEAVLASYHDFCRARRHGARPRPLVVAFVPGDADYRHETWAFGRSLPGLELVVCSWERRDRRGPLVPRLPDGRRPDVIHRIFRSPYVFADRLRAPRGLLQALREGRDCHLVNPWNDALEDKRLLALLHDPAAPRELSAWLPSDDLALLRERTPPTFLATPAAMARVTDQPRRARDFYLKQGRSNQSRALFDGGHLNRGAWNAACARVLAEGDWILQEAVRGAPFRFRYLDPEDAAARGPAELREMAGYVRISPHYTRRADGSVRLAEVTITAREHGSRVHGASDAVEIVP